MTKTDATSAKIYYSNRGSAIFKQALSELGWRRFEVGDEAIDFLYFDSYGDQPPPSANVVDFQLIDRQRTIPLDNKASMAVGLLDAGITFPRVFFDVADMPNSTEDLWYVKDPQSTGGKGIAVVAGFRVPEFFKPGYIIQEAVSDLLLFQGYKFTLRLYVLVHRGILYLFDSGLMVRHAQPYDPNSEDPAVQYDHSGYMKEDGEVKLYEFSELPQYQEVLLSLQKTIPSIFVAFKNLLKYEPDNCYCLFGVDMLVRKDLSTVLVEINDRPNIVHTKVINEEVNIPMVRSMVTTITGETEEERERDEVPIEANRHFRKIAQL